MQQTEDPSRLWAVLPVKNLGDAKHRLSGILTASERRTLFAAMVEDVLSALAVCDDLAGVVVVTQDPQAHEMAARYGAQTLVELENRGHTEATTFGASALADQGAAGMIQVPGDIPLVTAADVSAVLRSHRQAPAVTIAPSRDELGSNAVACSPPDVLPLRFGDDSFFPHLERARSLGIEPTVVERPGIALDVDTPADLAVFLASPSETRAYAYLQESGIADRFTARNAAHP
ncbi:MAG: 2-phospho-L-lactate guanylyltransferase [Pseudomonadota bacterium]